ncbi:HU family DNA-binding protein [Candidatus Odyssella thessalonicensis]|uniref:HU family DNA-binding protein n=1 Tax=Candidatus Odyssella thessalonicensis TaxID=84647 RepID=UPI000225B947|nr:HU family DNA-binding protein [Candidatus Odyssella thessalonicensis]
MNKTDLIKTVSEQCNLPQSNVNQVFDAILATVTASLKKKEEVNLPGFGKFKVTERAARKGRNPQTGQEITIAASKSPSFSAGKALKDAVN